MQTSQNAVWAKFATCAIREYDISVCVESVSIRAIVRRRRWTWGRGNQCRRVSPETPGRPGYAFVPCWPRMVSGECNFT